MEQKRQRKLKCELYNDNYQNWRKYPIKKAQLIISDLPYNVGNNFFASRVDWYLDNDSKNGESEKANKPAFYSDYAFNIAEFFSFCAHLLRKEPTGKVERGRSSDAPCMILFCSFEQIPLVKQYGEKYGFPNSMPLFFIKNHSPQVLKANMRIVGAVEYAMLLYRDRLPKFRNNGKMIFNWMPWDYDYKKMPKIHYCQKPYGVVKKLIETFTDPGDCVIDCAAGSAVVLRAAKDCGRDSFGFEIDKNIYKDAVTKMLDENYISDEKQIDGQMSIADYING